MDELKHITAIVKYILETEPDTRSNDGLLYVKVCQFYNPSIDLFPFGTVLANVRYFDIPPYSSVDRARRKIQAKYEHLKACKTVKGYRANNEIKYKAFALDMNYE